MSRSVLWGTLRDAVWGALTVGALAVMPAQAQMQIPGTFAVSESGAATYTIPLNLPPGVGGMEPKLELVYNSQRGDGPLGVGWALSGLSSIVRCPQTMAQDGVRGAVNYDSNDRFCLDGQRFVVTSGTYGVSGAIYGTEIDSYRRASQAGGVAGDPVGPTAFIVTTKEGLTMNYGVTDDSRLQVNGRTTNVAWLLTGVRDRLGNRYDITYLKDVANGVGYPTRIDYTANNSTGLTAASSVLFDYEGRFDEIPAYTYHAGSLAGRHILRLAKIRTQTDAGARAVQEYRLGYGVSPSTGRPRIETITQCSAAGVCLPATTFAFASPETVTRVTSGAVPSFATAAGVTTLAGDYNGDGRTDLMFRVVRNSTLLLLYGNADGSWRQASPAPDVKGVSCCLPVVNEFTHVPEFINSSLPVEGDFNGDGFQDIATLLTEKTATDTFDQDSKRIYTSTTSLRLYRSGGEGVWNGSSLNVTGTLGAEFINSMIAHVGDFDGDGRADLLLRSNKTNELYVFFSNGDGTWRIVKSTPPAGLNSGVGSVFVGDFNGDGKHDLTIQRSDFTTIPIFFSNGDGTWTTTNTAVPTWATTGSPAQLGDFNGDGKTDLLILGTDTLSVLLAKGNGEWGPIVSTLSAQDKQDMATGFCTVGDYNGDGRHDLAYGCGPGSTTLTWFYSMGNGGWRTNSTTRAAVALEAGKRIAGDFDGSGTTDVVFRAGDAATMPVLFSRIDNGERLLSITEGNGAVTQMDIGTLMLSGNYTRGETVSAPLAVTNPAIRVVSSANDGFKTLKYTYSSAVFEIGTGRGFLGFSTMAVRDDYVDTTTTMKYRYDWPFTGRLHSHIVLQGLTDAGTAPAIVLSKAIQFTCQNPATAPVTVLPGAGAAAFAPGQVGNCAVAPGSRYQVWASRSVESGQDISRSLLPGRRTEISDMDKFGNPGRVRVDALNPNGTNSGNYTITDTWYTNDDSSWFLGLPIKRAVSVTKP